MGIVVIGGGVIGLTCALELARTGRRVTVISADPPERTTSAVAAAVWFPYEAAPEDDVLRWGAATLEAFTALAGDPATGVALRSGVVCHRTPDPDLGWTRVVGAHRPATAAELPDGVPAGTRCTLPVIEMEPYLRWLRDAAVAAGVEVRHRRIARLGEVDAGADAIVVAAGLGSGPLTGDPSMVPVRGQVARLRNPGLTDWILDADTPPGLTYKIPRGADVVAGGTAERGAADLAADLATEDAILRRVRALAPALRDAEVLTRGVGLRPVRPAVRLERHTVDGRAVISCYGHGGAGVTLSWGCAADVVALAG
jgi:D-amino-acid oxidase